MYRAFTGSSRAIVLALVAGCAAAAAAAGTGGEAQAPVWISSDAVVSPVHELQPFYSAPDAAPYVVDLAPSDGSTGNSLQPEILAELRDPDSDVDPSSVRVELEGLEVAGSLEQTEYGYRFQGYPGFRLGPRSVGTLRVRAADETGLEVDQTARFRTYDWAEERLLYANVRTAAAAVGSDGAFHVALDTAGGGEVLYAVIQEGESVGSLRVPALLGPMRRLSIAVCPDGAVWLAAAPEGQTGLLLTRGDLGGFTSPLFVEHEDQVGWSREPLTCDGTGWGHLLAATVSPAEPLTHYSVDAGGVLRATNSLSGSGWVRQVDLLAQDALLHAVGVHNYPEPSRGGELRHWLDPGTGWEARGRILPEVDQAWKPRLDDRSGEAHLVFLEGAEDAAGLLRSVSHLTAFEDQEELPVARDALTDVWPTAFLDDQDHTHLAWLPRTGGVAYSRFAPGVPSAPRIGPQNRRILALGQDTGGDAVALTTWAAGELHLLYWSPIRECRGIPRILAAGWYDSEIHRSTGGHVTLLAVVQDPDDDVETVELYFQREPTGTFLRDDGASGDFAAGDTVYGLTAQVPPGVEPGEYLFELRATDAQGQTSALWPYLTVAPTAHSWGTSDRDGDVPEGTVGWLESKRPGPRPGSVPQEPRILVAGYYDSALVTGEAGPLTVLAWVDGVEAGQGAVGLYFEGGWEGDLRDDGTNGDWTPGDTLFGWSGPAPADVPADEWLLEMAAREGPSGPYSTRWPYLTVVP